MTVALVTVSVNPRLSVEIKDLVTKPRVKENTGCLTRYVVAVTSGRRRSAGSGTYKEKAVMAIVLLGILIQQIWVLAVCVYRLIHS